MILPVTVTWDKWQSQQGVSLFALKMAKVFLAGFKLHPVYVGCQQIQTGQRKRDCHCAEAGSEAGYGVCGLYMTFYTKNWFSLYSFSSQLPYSTFVL